jgi:hypothetical protein
VCNQLDQKARSKSSREGKVAEDEGLLLVKDISKASSK